MATRNAVLNYSCNEMQLSPNKDSTSSEEFRRTYAHEDNDNDFNEQIDYKNKQHKTVQSMEIKHVQGDLNEPYQFHRRSSVQIVEKKFMRSISNQMTSAIIADNDLTGVTDVSDAVCEFLVCMFLLRCVLNRSVVRHIS